MHLWWLTNYDAPYRRPVWGSLAQRLPVSVGLTGDPSSPQAAVRGHDWFDHVDSRYTSVPLPVRRVRLRGHDVPLATAEARALVDDATHLVVAGWEAPVYWQLARRARARGARVVGFYESTSASHTYRRGPVAALRARHFRGLDGVVVPGPAAAAAVLGFGVPEQRIHIGFNPIDVSVYAQRAEVARLPAEPAVAGGHRYVYVGQLIPRKNVATLINAFAEVAEAGDTLDIVGDGVERERLERLAVATGAAVTFHGHVPTDDVAALIAHRHTLVLPSAEEVWGLVVNEALAAGLQAVVTAVCGVASSVEGMPGVHLCPTPGATELAASLRASRASWRGWIQQPPILQHTPERFADLVWGALDG